VAKSVEPRKWSEIEYIRCELDAKLRGDLAEWLKKNKHDWFAYIENAVADGLRFGAHNDEYNKCVEARLTLLSNSVQVNTLVLQGRGPDLMTAIQALFFKHHIVLEKDWTSLDRAPEFRFESWG
jgi:hypothetical protein